MTKRGIDQGGRHVSLVLCYNRFLNINPVLGIYGVPHNLKIYTTLLMDFLA